jgi:hypothetical protein
MHIDTTSELTIIESLAEIANDLIVSKAIKINDNTFSLIDIEVYYWHKNHQDDFAKGVNHDKEFGELEAHRYGIDISLGNNKNLGFGGILICGLFDNQKNIPIEKPLVHRTLFNSLKMLDNTIEFVPQQNVWTNVFRSKRNNLGIADNENKRKYADSFYKFLASNSSIFSNYRGKETIFKNSELSDQKIKELLGYSIKR